MINIGVATNIMFTSSILSKSYIYNTREHLQTATSGNIAVLNGTHRLKQLKILGISNIGVVQKIPPKKNPLRRRRHRLKPVEDTIKVVDFILCQNQGCF